jgi:1,4-alpha-glucan branching enzyme
MIWMGEEFGDYHPKVTDPEKIDWTLLKNENNQQLREHYKCLIHLRRQNLAMQRNDLDYIFEHKEDGILAYTRWDDTGKKIVVIANLRDRHYDTYAIPYLPDEGEWLDVLTGEKITIQNRTWTGKLDPWESKVLVKG